MATEEQIRYIRLLIGDRDGELFSDEEIAAIIGNTSGAYDAAADALYIVAASAAMTQKCVTLLDVRVDGKSSTEAILAAADAFRQRAREAEANTIVCGVISSGAWEPPTHIRPWWEALL